MIITGKTKIGDRAKDYNSFGLEKNFICGTDRQGKLKWIEIIDKQAY